MAKQSFSITGDKEIQRILEEIAPRHARNLLRATVHGVASQIAKDAKQGAPRDTGNLKKSIRAERKKSPPDRPVADVVIRSRGPKSAFYWKFIELGTKNRGERPFIRPAYDRARADINNIFREQFGKKLESALKRAAKKKGSS